MSQRAAGKRPFRRSLADERVWPSLIKPAERVAGRAGERRRPLGGQPNLVVSGGERHNGAAGRRRTLAKIGPSPSASVAA